jgi:hypothetical protein
LPRSRNTSVRAKDTSRAEARRRHKDETRTTDAEPNTLTDEVTPDAAPTSSRPRFRIPDIASDVRALPQVFRKPLVWLPFGLLIGAFALELARQEGLLPEGQIGDIATLYIQLTLPPTALFVFFIGGFVAPRASYLVGAMLGVLDALLITILVGITPAGDLEEAGITEVASDLVPLWGIAIAVGIFAAGFAAWYRSFLRSSQVRAKANRAAKEQEQAARAKEQARQDKADAREAKRKAE